MATVDDVKTALVNKLETSIASASPEQLAYIAKSVNSIEPPIAWSIKDSDFSGANYNGYFIDTTNGEVTVTLPSVSGNTTGDGRVNIVDLKQNFQTPLCVPFRARLHLIHDSLQCIFGLIWPGSSLIFV